MSGRIGAVRALCTGLFNRRIPIGGPTFFVTAMPHDLSGVVERAVRRSGGHQNRFRHYNCGTSRQRIGDNQVVYVGVFSCCSQDAVDWRDRPNSVDTELANFAVARAEDHAAISFFGDVDTASPEEATCIASVTVLRPKRQLVMRNQVAEVLAQQLSGTSVPEWAPVAITGTTTDGKWILEQVRIVWRGEPAAFTS